MRIIRNFITWPWRLLPLAVGIAIALACGLGLWSNESLLRLANWWNKGKIEVLYRNRASNHYANKEFKLALEVITEAINLNADNPENYLLRGKIQRGQKSYEAALVDFDKLLSLAPPKACMVFQGHLQQGLTQLEWNKYDQAIDSLSTAIDIHYRDCYFISYDEYIDIFYYRAQAKEKAGFNRAAIEDYQAWFSHRGPSQKIGLLDPEERLKIEERLKQLLEPN